MTLTSEKFKRFQTHNKTGSFREKRSHSPTHEMISQKNPSKAQTQFVGNQIFILVLSTSESRKRREQSQHVFCIFKRSIKSNLVYFIISTFVILFPSQGLRFYLLHLFNLFFFFGFVLLASTFKIDFLFCVVFPTSKKISKQLISDVALIHIKAQ